MQSLVTPYKNRILIVDDVSENLRILSEVLKDNYTIMFARNGKDAIRLANSEPAPDLILLDIIMPGMNGYEVCDIIRNKPDTKNIPIMFISAQDNENDEAYGLSLGANDYIRKPFKASLIKNRVANQLEFKRYRDNLEDIVAERTKKLNLTQEVTIHAMASLAEWRDPETGEHILRTQFYVRALATHLATKEKYKNIITPDFVNMIYLSAPLHDVGKIGIADSILQNHKKLNEEDFNNMKQHTIIGYEVLQESDKLLGGKSFLTMAGEIAYCHHERWDGKGYPRGIKGEEIPLAARIMSVADVYDALRSIRVYKPAMDHEKSKNIIIEGKGTQFDPDIVDAFLELEDTFKQISEEQKDKIHHEEKITKTAH